MADVGVGVGCLFLVVLKVVKGCDSRNDHLSRRSFLTIYSSDEARFRYKAYIR